MKGKGLNMVYSSGVLFPDNCLSGQLSTTTAGVKENFLSVPRFFSADCLFPEDVPRIFSADQRDFFKRSTLNIRGTIRWV